MTLVVDASVALKWFLDEADRDAALALLDGRSLAAPDFLLLECANTFAVKVRRHQMDAADARRSLGMLKDSMGLRFWPSQPYIEAAQEIALELGRSAYDSLYLSLAMAQRMTVLTADEKFAAAVRNSRRHSVFLQQLAG